MKTFLLGLLLVASCPVFAQLNNVDFSMNFVSNPTFSAGLDEIARQGDVLQVKVTLNDVNFVGELAVSVWDVPNNIPVSIKKLDRSELLSGTYTENGLIVFNFPYIEPAGNYQVILETQNSSGEYLPRIEKTFQ